MTLTFNLFKKCFKWHFSSSRTTIVQNYFEIHALLYTLCSGQLNTCIWPSIFTFIWLLWLWPSTYLKCFKWYFSSSRATTVPNCIEIHALLYVMVRTNSDGRTDALTHGRTHIHPTKIVTTMSRIPASGLDKNIWLHVICIQVLAHCVTPSPYFLTGFS